MDWKIIVAAIGFGAGAEGLRQYQKWKSRRRDRPAEVRNAGFWTDKRLLWAETAIVFAVVAIPFTGFMWIAKVDYVYPGLLIYAAFSFLLLRGLNRYQGP